MQNSSCTHISNTLAVILPACDGLDLGGGFAHSLDPILAEHTIDGIDAPFVELRPFDWVVEGLLTIVANIGRPSTSKRPVSRK